jgi:hypothetical protein
MPLRLLWNTYENGRPERYCRNMVAEVALSPKNSRW